MRSKKLQSVTSHRSFNLHQHSSIPANSCLPCQLLSLPIRLSTATLDPPRLGTKFLFPPGQRQCPVKGNHAERRSPTPWCTSRDEQQGCTPPPAGQHDGSSCRHLASFPLARPAVVCVVRKPGLGTRRLLPRPPVGEVGREEEAPREEAVSRLEDSESEAPPPPSLPPAFSCMGVKYWSGGVPNADTSARMPMPYHF